MVTFNPRQASQGLAFELQFERLSGLVSDMEQIRHGTSVYRLAIDAPRLDDWAAGARPARCLVGRSTGHPTLPGARRPITTSDVVLISDDGAWARTLSRWYRLGDPLGPTDPDWRGTWSWQ